MPVLTMSTMAPHTLKGRKQFNKLVNQRNHANSMMSALGSWKQGVADKARLEGDRLKSNLDSGWERHASAMRHVQEHGINGSGELSTFHHEHGKTKIHGRVGAHQGSSTHDGWNTSSNSLKAVLFDGTLHSEGNHWDVDASLAVGGVDASVSHAVVADNIKVSDGLKNGPKASIRGSADLVDLSITGSIGTATDAAIGARLQLEVDASWGARASASTDVSSGINPLNLSNLGPSVHGDVSLVIDRQVAGSSDRSQIATVNLNNGKLDANINWREMGAAMGDIGPLTSVFSGGLDVV